MAHRRHVFYSWQSDLAPRLCRSFIQNSLERALKRIGKDDSTDIVPVLDRDTSGVPGTPSITDSIFEKIAACDVFVADVSIVNAGEPFTFLGFSISQLGKKSRLTPNPNVLIELGFAVTHVGWDRIILVQNAAFGSPEDLPFDLRGRRVVPYSISQLDTKSKKEERDELSQRLEGALRDSLEPLDSQWKKPDKWEPRWWGFWKINSSFSGHGGSLFVREVSNQGFYFHLTVYNGSHSGAVSGFAHFLGRFSADAWIVSKASHKPCLIQFRRVAGDPTIVKVIEVSDCQLFHGMGASFDGTFHRRTEHLFGYGLLREIDIQRLYSITGQHFLPMMEQFSSVGREEVLDTFQAEAFYGFLRGLAPWTGAIVMKGEQGQLWAAFLDHELIRYFTTEPDYKNKLPQTIEAWIKRFREQKEVIFESAVQSIPKRP